MGLALWLLLVRLLVRNACHLLVHWHRRTTVLLTRDDLECVEVDWRTGVLTVHPINPWAACTHPIGAGQRRCGHVQSSGRSAWCTGVELRGLRKLWDHLLLLLTLHFLHLGGGREGVFVAIRARLVLDWFERRSIHHRRRRQVVLH